MSFEQKGDPGTGGRADLLDMLSENPAFSGKGLEIPHQNVDGGGLARSVLAQKTYYAALLHLEVKVLIDLPFSVPVRQVLT